MNTQNCKDKYVKESSALAYNSARQRLSALFDCSEYTELDRFAKNGDIACGVVTAWGNVNGVTVYAFSQDSTVFSGAFGAAQAAKLERLYALAEKNGCPIVAIFDSAGGYLLDGVATMTAYGKLIGYASRLSGVIPQISVIAGQCTGAAKLLADMADLTVGVGEGEWAVTADNDIEAVKAAAELLSYLPQNNLSEPLWSQQEMSDTDYSSVESTINSVCDAGSVTKLYSVEKECVKVYLTRISGAPAGVCAVCSDEDICAGGARKATRFVRMCDAFSIPIFTVLDAVGFGDAKSAAALAHAYAEATAPKVTLICGSAVGQVFIALASYGANIDAVFAWDRAVITPLKPCTAVQLLYKDRLSEGEKREVLEDEYAKTEGSPFNAAAQGCIDNIILPEDTAKAVRGAFDNFAGKRVSTLDKKHSNMPF